MGERLFLWVALVSASPLRHLLDTYGLTPDKGYGQHFLCDQRVLDRIAGAVSGANVVEIGPGPGCLTQHLIRTPGRHVVVWEKDQRFEPLLRDMLAPAKGVVIMGDALTIPWDDYEGFHVAGNLPYNISVPLILRYVAAAGAHGLGPGVFMVQKEVADRLLARPHTKSYGRLSIMAQTYTRVSKIVAVPPASFWPRPKVYSCVVKMVPYAPNIAVSFDQLSHVVAKAFACRRKMLRHAFGDGPLWERTGIDPCRRAETLTLAEFWSLAHTFYTIAHCPNTPS
jgi:16S rRNA (adenine1518-N6/adenine1519-N6)-dimethyltransferase